MILTNSAGPPVWFRIAEIAAWFAAHRTDWYALPVVMLAFVVLGLMMVPVVVLIAATGIAFGPVLGPVYAMAGSLASASTGFAIGRWVGFERVQRLGGKRIAHLTLVNIIVGASTVCYVDFLIGTVLGMVALVIGLAGFGYHFSELLRDPTPRSLASAATFVIVPLTLALLIKYALRRVRPA